MNSPPLPKNFKQGGGNLFKPKDPTSSTPKTLAGKKKKNGKPQIKGNFWGFGAEGPPFDPLFP